MFKVKIKNIKIKAKIGVSKKERKKTQALYVTLSFKYNLLETSLVLEVDISEFHLPIHPIQFH